MPKEGSSRRVGSALTGKLYVPRSVIGNLRDFLTYQYWELRGSLEQYLSRSGKQLF